MYNGQYFYCYIQLEGLLYIAEHDLVAIAKFLALYKLVHKEVQNLLLDLSNLHGKIQYVYV